MPARASHLRQIQDAVAAFRPTGTAVPLLPGTSPRASSVRDRFPRLRWDGRKAPVPRSGIADGGPPFGAHVLLMGALMAAFTLGVQSWAIHAGDTHRQTMTFTTLTLVQMGQALAFRSEHRSLFQLGCGQTVRCWPQLR